MTLTLDYLSSLLSGNGKESKSLLCNPKTQVSQLLTDSRTPVANYSDCIFFALRTNTDDGHRYIGDLYARGVRSFVVEHLPEDVSSMSEGNFIICDNVSEALAQTAATIRRMAHCPIVAVTGSRGKTVLKEMLYAAVGSAMRTVRSPRSWNSQIGVPKSLWLLESDTELGIFEAGVSHRGEMARLANMIRPEIGVFTALTEEHSGGFDSIEEKAAEKALLFAGCKKIFFPSDDTIIADTLENMYPAEVLCPVNGGLHNLCAIIAEYLGVKGDTTNEKIARASKLSGRIDVTELAESASVAYDHYACDVDGIITALDFVKRRLSSCNKLVAVIGNLDCFPADADIAYKGLGEELVASGVDTLYTIGESIEKYTAAFDNRLNIVSASNISEIYNHLSDRRHADSVVYINTPDKNNSAMLRDRLCALRHITRMNIDLEALVHNFKYYKSLTPKGTGTIAMIKASAYGCGAVEVARTLEAAGGEYFAVAVVDEGASLRQAGVQNPVIVLDPWCTDPKAIAINRLEPTLIAPNEELLRSLDNAAAEAGIGQFNVHVKLDTGMHRLGLNEEQIDEFARMLVRYPRLSAVSTFSHLATADCLDQDDYTRMQLDKFKRMSDALESAIGKYSGHHYHILRHILNTAGISRYGATDHHDMVRLGIGLYGISPLSANPALHPVASLTTTVIAVSHYPSGATIGYGRRGLLKRDSIIATLPIGYADGINRHLGCGNASFLINGKMCPTVGNICMDLCMVDVTECPDVHVGTTVEIFGKNAPIERLAETLGTIPYEILTSVSPRVKRVYFRE